MVFPDQVVRLPANVAPAPPTAFTVKVTGMLFKTMPFTSLTTTPSAVPKTELIAMFCGVLPAGDAVTENGVGVRLVRLKTAGVTSPVTVALTAKAPTVAFAVKAVAVAIPLAFVTAVFVNGPPKLPDAPEPGAVNVTVRPATAAPTPSVTLADISVG